MVTAAASDRKQKLRVVRIGPEAAVNALLKLIDDAADGLHIRRQNVAAEREPGASVPAFVQLFHVRFQLLKF